MATKAATPKAPQRIIKKVSFVHIQKLLNSVSLLAFSVVLIAGAMHGVSVSVIAFRAIVVLSVIGVITRIVIRILSTYEEMNSGKA